MEISATMGGTARKNEFEKVEGIVDDAITLELVAQDGVQFGVVHCPAAATAGRLPKDYKSAPLEGREAFRSAIKLANDLRLAIVVLDPQDLWPAEWGALFVAADEDTGP